MEPSFRASLIEKGVDEAAVEILIEQKIISERVFLAMKEDHMARLLECHGMAIVAMCYCGRLGRGINFLGAPALSHDPRGEKSSITSWSLKLRIIILFISEDVYVTSTHSSNRLTFTPKDRKELFQQKMRDARAAGVATELQSKKPKSGVLKRINVKY
jgi:hypothetical protein